MGGKCDNVVGDQIEHIWALGCWDKGGRERGTLWRLGCRVMKTCLKQLNLIYSFERKVQYCRNTCFDGNSNPCHVPLKFRRPFRA